eukprot:COSAG05_NODE_866_length_6876_cov_11.223255_6_plen_134_part_00
MHDRTTTLPGHHTEFSTTLITNLPAGHGAVYRLWPWLYGSLLARRAIRRSLTVCHATVCSSADGSVAVALYNEEDTPRSIGTSFAALGWPASTKASVRDLWAHSDNGTATGELKNVSVRAHATVVVRLTPLKG